MASLTADTILITADTVLITADATEETGEVIPEFRVQASLQPEGGVKRQTFLNTEQVS